MMPHVLNHLDLTLVYHPLRRDWLLATNKIEVEFHNIQDRRAPGHGSGFWIRNGTDLLFATNRHVIDLEYSNPKYRGQGYVLASVTILTFDTSGRPGRQRVVVASILTHEDPQVDIALLRVAAVNNLDNITVVPANLEVIADSNFLSSELEWGAQVTFSSFQPWRDTLTERPILRTGIVASDPAYPFVSNKVELTKVHLLEAFSFAGSSGSPVFANPKGIKVGAGLTGGDFRPGRIIGIMAGHLRNEDGDTGAPYRTHTGLSYCHRSDLLLSMVYGSETMQESTFTMAAPNKEDR